MHLASGADTLGHSKAQDVYSASQVYLSVSLLSLPLFFCLPLPPPSLLLAFISCITMQFFSLMFLVYLKRYMTCNALPTWRDSEPTAYFETDLSQLVVGTCLPGHVAQTSELCF